MDLTAAELAHYMAPGWNLGNTLEAGGSGNNFTNNGGLGAETSWQGTKTTQEIIDLVKAKGFNSIRVPVSWVMGHLTDNDNLTVDPVWMARIKEVVDYCIAANLYVIINDHWDGGWLEKDGFNADTDVAMKKEQLRKLWTNLANAFKDYDERLLFAGLNEPDANGYVDRLQEYEQVFIDAVRATGGNNANRVLIVQGPATNIEETNKSFDATKFKDTASNRLMVEIHHYGPYQFCLMEEDASWGKVHMYIQGHTPNRYSTNSGRHVTTNTLNDIKKSFDLLKTNFVDKGFPVILGEYGANHKKTPYADYSFVQSAHDNSIQYWYNVNTQYAMQAGCVPFAWDTNYTGWPHMTVFNRNTIAVADSYIYNGIMEGDQAARAAYTSIYPEPSATNGIRAVADEESAEADVYDLSGRKVTSKVKNIGDAQLSKGIYIFHGKKYVVR